MEMLYLGFKGMKAVFCIAVIVYVVRNWRR